MDNTLFISDLHAGSPLFRHRSLLTNLINDSVYKKIVVVGDVIDTWEGSIESTLNLKLSPIEDLRNSNKDVYIIRGNHDPDLCTLRHIFPEAFITNEFLIIDDVLIVHGHEFDDLVIKYNRLASYLHKVHWIFERVGINFKAFFRELFYSISAKINRPYYKDLVFDIMDKVILKYKSYSNVIITGHTHMPMIASHLNHPGVTYINCGDWVHNFSYVEYVDGEFYLTALS